jgi:Tol biopolymer transport system component
MPDGRSVIAAAADALPPGHVQLWQITWPAGARTQLTFGLNDYDNVAVSAAGRTVAAIEEEYTSNIWVQPLTGGPGRQITSNMRGSGDDGLAWTPDSRVVYAAFSGNTLSQLWIMDADGTHAKQLTTMFAMTPAVSPDGKWIYFSGGPTPSSTSIWKLPIDGDPVPVTSGKSDVGPIVSRDGKWLYFTFRDGALARTMKISTDGGPATALTDLAPGFIAIQLSQDGSHLLGFATNPATHRRQAVRLSVNGGRLEFVDNVPRNGGPVPDGTSWIFNDTRDGIHGLFLKPLTGGPDRLLVDVGQELIGDFDTSRDSRTLAYVRYHQTSDVVLIRAK